MADAAASFTTPKVVRDAIGNVAIKTTVVGHHQIVVESFIIFIYSNPCPITDPLSHMTYVDSILLLHFLGRDATAYRDTHAKEVHDLVVQSRDRSSSRLPVLMLMNYQGSFHVELKSAEDFLAKSYPLHEKDQKEARKKVVNIIFRLKGKSDVIAVYAILAEQPCAIPLLFTISSEVVSSN